MEGARRNENESEVDLNTYDWLEARLPPSHVSRLLAPVPAKPLKVFPCPS